MPENPPQPRFQFSLAALLAIVTVVSILCSSFASGGLPGVLVCLPAALAGTAVILGAGPRGLRWICLIWAACGVLFFLLRAVASYPFIEIADGLGGGAMERVGDWMSLCLACVAAVFAIVIGHFVRRVSVRLVLTLGLLAFIVTRQFQVPTRPTLRAWPSSRWQECSWRPTGSPFSPRAGQVGCPWADAAGCLSSLVCCSWPTGKDVSGWADAVVVASDSYTE